MADSATHNQDGSDEEEDAMDVETNVAGRSAELQQLRQEIQEKQTRLQALEKAHDQHILRASLLCDAQYHYTTLWKWSQTKKWKRENVLLALQSDVIPDIFRWDKVEGFEANCPRRLLYDREVLLARLKLDDFESTFVCEAYQVPPKFRNDKEVMLAVCAKNSHALELASKTLKNDSVVVLAAIQQQYHFAPLALQFASARLRGDKKLVRVALNRDHGIRCVKYLAPKLQKDKRLILTSIRRSSAQCSETYEHLSELPEELCADEEIVMAAVRKRGSNLRFITAPHLVDDLDVVLAACKQDGNSIKFVPRGPTRKTMKKSCNRRTILVNGGGATFTWTYSSKKSEEFLLAAVQNGATEITNLDTIFHKNQPLLLQMLHCSSRIYDKLPAELKTIPTIAQAALESESLNETTAASILRQNPSMYSNEDVMMIIASNGFEHVLSRAPDEILDNKDIMTKACQANGASFDTCSERLQQDPDVIAAALTSEMPYPDCVFLLNKELLKQNPNLAELAIETYDGHDPKKLYDFLPPAILHNKSVLLKWLGKGWTIDRFPFKQIVQDGSFSHDQDVLLAMLRHDFRLSQLNPCSCQYEDFEFLEAAVDVDGRVMNSLEGDYEHDFHLMVRAVGTHRKTLQAFWHHGRTIEVLVEFARDVREKLEVANVFIREFLGGIDVVVPHVAPAKRCRLPMLDRGYETSAGLKKLIAQYADVPIGEELTLLRAAAANLEFWGY